MLDFVVDFTSAMWVGELCQAEEMPEQNMVKGQDATGLSSCEENGILLR